MSKNKKKKNGRMGFFKVRHRWQDEWKDMPEFIQEDLTPYKTLYVHFYNRNDLEEFAKLIKQKITEKTRSIYYPEVKNIDMSNIRYIDTNNKKENN